MKLTLFTLIAAANAFPMVKRQIVSSITEVIPTTLPVPAGPSSILSAASSVVEPMLPSSAASMLPSAASILPSAASSAASASPSLFPGALAFPCPDGSSLAYVERQMNVNASLADTLASVANFANSTLFTISNTTGENTVGATRTILVDGASADELLTNYTINGETGAIYATWNSTNTIMASGITVPKYSTEQQTYINDTETSDAAPVSTIKIFSNICASDKTAAESAFGVYFESALNNATQAILSSSSATPSSAVSSAIASAVSSAVSSVLSSAVPIAVSSGVFSSGPMTSFSSAVASATSSAGSAAQSGASSISDGFAPSPSSAAGSPLLVNTPASIVQCQPTAILFSGGSAPYFLSVLPGGQPSATPLIQFAEQPSAGTYTWVVNIAAGTSVTLAIRDGTGAINYSSPVTILPGTDSSCLVV